MDVTRLPADAGVSDREAEVLEALGEHLTNAEIADRLFISVRTVESHVSSLLRKLSVSDRRGLATLAGTLLAGPDADRGREAQTYSAPSPLTPFIGRDAERAELGRALSEHRLVTAVGPGGVGKTRLALTVIADASGQFADGAWFVDLVPVIEPSLIGRGIADALGLGEQQQRSAQETVRDWLADRNTLLVLDNCEHLLGGVGILVERLLADSPGLVVLATSRARLMAPFEWVFPVPGLSLAADDDGRGDAVELFLGRARAGGARVAPEDEKRVAAVCRELDGMALAIELAAARLPALGLDGLEAGLADAVGLLKGPPRVDDRHRSLRATLDWSYTLLDEADRAVLRRVSVFARSFTGESAAAMLGDWRPVRTAALPRILGELADQSLLVAVSDRSGTRYRPLETIRQYGADRLAEAGEATVAHARHLAWCLSAVDQLAVPTREAGAAWRTAFDRMADDLRAAVGWAAGSPDHRQDAHLLALQLAELSFGRGLLGESQRRYEQAAGLAPDDRSAAGALRSAAGAALTRHFGNDGLRLLRTSADLALRAGDRAGAALDLGQAAELINRGPGLVATLPPVGRVQALLREAWELAAGDANAEARTMVAEAFVGAEIDPLTAELADRAVTLAYRTGDPLVESAALDELTAVQLGQGELRAAQASVAQRIELLEGLPITADSGLEFFDVYGMATDCSLAAGDLHGARRHGEALRDLPFHREEGHLGSARLIVTAVLAGDWDEATGLAARFREGWERAGRPRAGNLASAAYALTALYGLRGDEDERARWQRIVDGLETPGKPLSEIHVGEFFDAWLLLHRGLPDEALALLDTPPEWLRAWHNGRWRPWYAAMWAEATVLSGHPDTELRLERARLSSRDNPIAAALVERAGVLAHGGHAGDRTMATVVADLEAAGCRYQWARTLVVRGRADRERGAAELAAMGATPMVWPLL